MLFEIYSLEKYELFTIINFSNDVYVLRWWASDGRSDMSSLTPTKFAGNITIDLNFHQ